MHPAKSSWVRDASELIDDLRIQWLTVSHQGAPRDTLTAFAQLAHAVNTLSAHVAPAVLTNDAYGLVFREINQIGFPEFFRRHAGDLAINPEHRLRDLCQRAGSEPSA